MDNGWEEWGKHVLVELERLNKYCEDLDKSMKQLSIDIATLKVKSGLWGLAGGLIPAIGILLVIFIKSSI